MAELFNIRITFIGAASFHFATGKIEDSRVLYVGPLHEMDSNVNMMGTIRMLLARANPLRNGPAFFLADTFHMAEQILKQATETYT